MGNCGHPSVSVGHVYGHAKCVLLPHNGKYSTLSVENKAQCSTLWKIEHTFPFELVWYHTLKGDKVCALLDILQKTWVIPIRNPLL